ncbi:MAG TPA: glycosyltransferase [Candidatus Dormibacteraeota bacterium]
MRLALIASLVSPIREPQCGGAQSFLADLAAGLARRGYEVDVFAASGSEIDGVRVVDVGIDASTLQEFLYRAGSSPPVDQAPFVAAYARVFEAISARSYDIVHNHAFDAPAIRCAVGIASPVIHTLHLPPEDSIIDALRDASRGSNPPVIATVSTSQADAWRRFVDIDTALPVGVVTAQIPWSATPGVGAVFAGRLSPEKGAADAIAIARRAGTAIDLYGDAYDDGYAQREVYALGDQPGVTIHPAVPRATLWRVVSGAAAVLCPVDWDEPFGLVAAEAQACATPVIAYARGGLQDIVVDGVTGFVVDPGDIGAAAAALGRVRGLERNACRRHAEAYFNIEAVLDAHERRYRNMLTSTLTAAHG